MTENKAVNQVEYAADSDSIRRENTPPNPLSEDEKHIEKRLVRKLDTLILPLIALSYFLNCIDRANYGAARLQHLEDDLHMSDSQFQAGLSVFYVGYVLFQLPSNMLLNHFGRPSWHIGLSVLAWGLVTGCTAAVNNFGGMLACRIILGCVGESAKKKAVINKITSCRGPAISGIDVLPLGVASPLTTELIDTDGLKKWYKKSELSLRISVFLAAGLVATATGSLIAAGVSSGLDGVRGLSAWRWLYLIEGIVSICGGLLVVIALPDFPHTWTALTPEMKEVAIRRLTLDASQTDVDKDGISPLDGLKLALADKKLYIMTIMSMCIIVATGSQNFFPTLTATLGYSHIISLLLVAPPYLFTAVYSCIHSHISDRRGRRFWYMMYPAPIAIAGFALFMSPVTTFGVRYFSMFLMLFIYSMNNTLNAWISTSISRPPAKRAAAYGFVAMMSNTCAIWTPFTYRERDSPHFRLALGLVIGMLVVTVALSILLRGVLVRENTRLDELDCKRSVVPGAGGDTASRLDIRSFRYTV